MTPLEILVARHLRHDDADPAWHDRDRLVAGAAQAGLVPPTAAIIPGPAGLAFGAALGMAIAERTLAARFGRSLVDHRTWLAATPSDLVSGIAQESALAAGALGLDRLAVLVALPQPDRTLIARMAAAGWNTRSVACGDEPAAAAAIAAATRAQKPTLIACIGAPPPPSAHTLDEQPGEPEPSAPTHHRGPGARRAWLKRLRRHPSREAFQHAHSGHLPPGWHRAAQPFEPGAPAEPDTASALRAALARLAPALPELTAIAARDHAARGLVWDGLDQACGGATLGLALHGGLLPVAWCTDAAMPNHQSALHAAACLGARLLHIVTGGLAQAPLLPSAGSLVFHPADAAEVPDCLILAIRHVTGPTILTASSDPPPMIAPAIPRLCTRGAYLLRAAGARDVTLIAAGTGVAPALALAELIAAQGLQAALVSMPCRVLFDAQDEAYRAMVLGLAPRIVFAGHDPAGFVGLAGPLDLAVTDPDPDLPRLLARLLRQLGRGIPAPDKRQGLCP